jgi:hypothetical protein
VQVLSEHHSIFEGMVGHKYSGIYNQSKVKHLINGISTDTVDSVKTQIVASPALMNDSTDTVILYTDFIKQHQIEYIMLNISAVEY